MSNAAFETLKRLYPSSFTENCHTSMHHYTPAFVIYQGDTLHQNTIDDSNVETIHEELVGMFPHYVHKGSRPYVEEVYVYADDLESDEELADRVLGIVQALDDYPVYDEAHYCDLEHERVVEYILDTLAHDLANELGRDDVEELFQWVHNNLAIVWEHNDGGVDDAPINTEELSELVKAELVS